MSIERQTSILKSFQSKLPEQMGFGYLKPSTISCSANECTADYFDQDNKIAHLITFDGKYYAVNHYELGKLVVVGNGDRIESALINSFQHYDLIKSERFINLKKEVCGSGNYYFHQNVLKRGEANITFYPAGVLVDINIMIPPEHRDFIPDIRWLLEREKMGNADVAPIKTELYTLDASMDMHIEHIELLTITLDLLSVLKIAQQLVGIKAILPQKKYRAIVNLVSVESLSRQHQVFLGDPEGHYLTYGINFQPNTSDDLNDVASMFKERSAQLLKHEGLI